MDFLQKKNQSCEKLLNELLIEMGRETSKNLNEITTDYYIRNTAKFEHHHISHHEQCTDKTALKFFETLTTCDRWFSRRLVTSDTVYKFDSQKRMITQHFKNPWPLNYGTSEITLLKK